MKLYINQSSSTFQVWIDEGYKVSQCFSLDVRDGKIDAKQVADMLMDISYEYLEDMEEPAEEDRVQILQESLRNACEVLENSTRRLRSLLDQTAAEIQSIVELEVTAQEDCRSVL